VNRELPDTERANPASTDLDRLSALEMVKLMNREDAGVARAVAEQATAIAEAIDVVAARLAAGGRLVYAGAGTSGRLGVLDAAECPPTFSADPSQVRGIIAGGTRALTVAVEGAEDSALQGGEDLRAIDIGPKDAVVGITASGTTPYVSGALERAREQGAATIALVCNTGSPLAAVADVAIEVVTGPEVLAGSTRLKAGTATKMVLNMLSTGAMVRLGKTYGNLMVDLQATNDKLRTRARRIVAAATGLDDAAAARLLDEAGGEVKTAVVMHALGVPAGQARRRLADAEGRLRQALAATAGPA